MKRYIIKLECNATDLNHNFKGEKLISYYGKEEKDLSDFNSYTKHIGTPIPWKVKEYGFKTKASAMKALKTHKECADYETAIGFWNDTVELVEVEV